MIIDCRKCTYITKGPINLLIPINLNMSTNWSDLYILSGRRYVTVVSEIYCTSFFFWWENRNRCVFTCVFVFAGESEQEADLRASVLSLFLTALQCVLFSVCASTPYLPLQYLTFILQVLNRSFLYGGNAAFISVAWVSNTHAHTSLCNTFMYVPGVGSTFYKCTLPLITRIM